VMDSFHFETQTVECSYCKKRVGVDYQYRHLRHCEDEEGRERFDPWWDDFRTHKAPLAYAINKIQYQIAKLGEDALLEAVLDCSIGTFAEERVEQTLTDSLHDAIKFLPLKDVLRLLGMVNCPLCHLNPCRCGKSKE
jgi:hypothetical protein